MTDREHPPRLQPPPRVAAADDRSVGTKDRNLDSRNSSLRKMGFGAVFAILILGVTGVFFVLPRWQTQRQNRTDLTKRAGYATAPEAPEVGPPARAVVEPRPSQPPPSPVPTASNTPKPVLTAPRPTAGPSRSERDFATAMSEGLRALDQGQWTTSKQAFDRAAGIRPDAPEVRDALARLEAGQRRDTIAITIRRGLELEATERWSEAVVAYSTILAADPESAAALDGRDRASLRVDLDEKLEYHLHNPGRLTNPPVLEDASALLEEASGVSPNGPRLAAQMKRLDQLIAIASEPLAVILESDNFTDVTVYRVGRLGTFSSRELKLRPGTYTAVGSRSGYRDIRVQFSVMPGTPGKSIVVRCTEQL